MTRAPIRKLSISERALLRMSQKHLPAKAIATVVADFYGIDLAAMLGPRCGRYLAHPRQIAMYLIYELTPLSLPMIAKFFQRDHTTIMYGVRITNARIARNDFEIGDKVRALRSQLEHAAEWSWLWQSMHAEHATLSAYARALESQANDDRGTRLRAIARPISEAECTRRRLERF